MSGQIKMTSDGFCEPNWRNIAISALYMSFFDITKEFKDSGLFTGKTKAPTIELDSTGVNISASSLSSVKNGLSRVCNKIIQDEAYFPINSVWRRSVGTHSDVSLRFLDFKIKEVKRSNSNRSFQNIEHNTILDALKKQYEFRFVLEASLPDLIGSSRNAFESHLNKFSMCIPLNNEELAKCYWKAVRYNSYSGSIGIDDYEIDHIAQNFEIFLINDHFFDVISNTLNLREFNLTRGLFDSRTISHSVFDVKYANEIVNTEINNGYSPNQEPSIDLLDFANKAFINRYRNLDNKPFAPFKTMPNRKSLCRGFISNPIPNVNSINIHNIRYQLPNGNSGYYPFYFLIIEKSKVNYLPNKIELDMATFCKAIMTVDVRFGADSISGSKFKESLNQLKGFFERIA